MIDGQYKMICSRCVFHEIKRLWNYLEFSDAYYHEDSYLVIVNVARNLASLYFRAWNEPFADEIKGFTIKYFRKILQNLGWKPKKTDKHTDALLRGFAISVLGKINDEQTTQKALKEYKKFLKSPRSISPDLIETNLFYCCMEWKHKNVYPTTKTIQKRKNNGGETSILICFVWISR